jgi:hypothetical protein
VGHAGLVTQKCGKTAWLLVVIGRERFHCNRANQKLQLQLRIFREEKKPYIFKGAITGENK